MSKVVFSSPKRYYGGRDVKRAHAPERFNATLYMFYALISLACAAVFFPQMTVFDGYTTLCGIGFAISALLGVIVNAHDLFAVMIRENRVAEETGQGAKLNGHIATMCLVGGLLGFNGSILTMQAFQQRINRTGLWQRMYSSLLAMIAAGLHLAKVEDFGSVELQLKRNTTVALMTVASTLVFFGNVFHFSSDECAEVFSLGSMFYIAGSAIECGAALTNLYHVREAQDLDLALERKERQRKAQGNRSSVSIAGAENNRQSGWISRFIPSLGFGNKAGSTKKQAQKQGRRKVVSAVESDEEVEQPRRSRKSK